MEWVFLSVAIICELIGTTASRSTDGFTKLYPTLILLVSYGIGFYFFSLALKIIPMGVAYALWSAVGIIFISVIGYFMHNQKLDMHALIGIALIIIGALELLLFSKTIGR